MSMAASITGRDFDRHHKEMERERAEREMRMHIGLQNPYSPGMSSSMISNKYDSSPEPHAPLIDMREVDNGHIQIIVTYSTGKKFAKDFFLQHNHHHADRMSLMDITSTMQSISSSVNKTLLKLFL